LFTIRLCSHSVVAALGTKAFTLAYLRRVLDLSWLGLLAKGPSHVLFFYLIVGAVLWRNRHLRDLTHPAHFIGVVVMLGIL